MVRYRLKTFRESFSFPRINLHFFLDTNLAKYQHIVLGNYKKYNILFLIIIPATD